MKHDNIRNALKRRRVERMRDDEAAADKSRKSKRNPMYNDDLDPGDAGDGRVVYKRIRDEGDDDDE